MKSFKRIVSTLLCTALVAGTMTACGGTANSSAPASPASSGGASSGDAAPAGGSVEFWNDKMTNTNSTILDNLVAAVKADSGLDVKIVSYPDVAAYQTALQQSIKEPSAPAAFTWWNGDQLNTLAKNGLLEDLTEEWEKYYIPAGVSPDVADSLSYEGKIYAAPYGVLNNTIVYNKRAFEKAGCEVPTTFDEFLAVCEKLKAAGITPIGLKDDSWAGFIWFQQFLAAHDPQLYTGVCDGSLPYTDQKIVDVMNVWRGMLDKGYFASPVKALDMQKAFSQDETAMMLEPTLTIPTLVKDYGMVSGQDFDAFALPSASGGKSVVFFEVSPLAIPAATKDKEAAKQFVRSFVNAGPQKVMANEIGMAASGKAEINDPTIAKMSGYSTDSEKYQLILRYYENTPAELRDVALDELAKFIYSGAPTDQVLATIQAKADETFKK